MPLPRKQQICLEDTPYYHCVSRCVRRAYLCGEDPLTGVSYEHRREWVEKRLLYLSSVFAIDICAYAVMSNHIHVVVKVDSEKANAWSTIEVFNRWHKLHKANNIAQAFLSGQDISQDVADLAEEYSNLYRSRLTDISWFMRELNEPIARLANKEDDCTGHFWEGRFKSQALLDEAALIACMAYVDLNPVRSKLCSSPENSEFTSVKRRIDALKLNVQPKLLYPFVGNSRESMPNGIEFELKAYLELLDLTGRLLRDGKKGVVDASLQPILQRLHITFESWQQITAEFETKTGRLVGHAATIGSYCEKHHWHRKPNKDKLKALA
ncbi:transposase [Marinomonas epiphytica]